MDSEEEKGKAEKGKKKYREKYISYFLLLALMRECKEREISPLSIHVADGKVPKIEFIPGKDGEFSILDFQVERALTKKMEYILRLIEPFGQSVAKTTFVKGEKGELYAFIDVYGNPLSTKPIVLLK